VIVVQQAAQLRSGGDATEAGAEDQGAARDPATLAIDASSAERGTHEDGRVDGFAVSARGDVTYAAPSAMALIKTEVTQDVVDYLARHAPQDAVLERVARETADMPRAEMATTPDEAALLTMLARLIGSRHALEVGTFTGYGAISIARGLREGGRLTCLELDENYAAIARRNLEDAGIADRVEIIVGPALDSLRAMPAEPTFDYVFLDADKTGYPDYYAELVPRLVPGGLLLIDNVLLRGRVTDPQDERERVIDAFNDRVAADPRVDTVMVLVADGLTFARRR
jgi:caffeoyl-CoA O-methyltransferase